MMQILKNCIFAMCTMTLVVGCSNSDDSSAPANPNNKPQQFAINGGSVSESYLPNGIRVVAISIPAATKPQASISVGVGSSHDPENLPGLAHFVEHMLFLGSKEYPNSLETNNLIENNDGYRNAYTAGFHTNYQLTTSSEAFPEALKRTSRYFVSPLFTKTLIEKEKNAIQNEFILRFDVFKMYRAISFLEGDRSQYTLFNIGNLESLKAATDEDARDFYNKYYSAKNMTIIVSGPQDIATLEKWIKDNFSDVPSKDVTLPKSVIKDEPKQNKIVKMNIPGSSPRLSITFKTQEVSSEKINNAQAILGMIMGDESPGSLLSVLQQEGLAIPRPGALSGSFYKNKIDINIDLTEAGVKNYTQVISYVKGYLQFLKNQEEARYILDERNGLEKAQLLTKDYSQLSVDDISRINDEFNKGEGIKKLLINETQLSYEPSDYLAARDSISNIEYAQIALISADDTADDTYSKLFSKTLFTDNHKLQLETANNKQYIVDGYYKSVSTIEDFSLSNIKDLTSENFSLPGANPYIPKNFITKSVSELESVQNLKTSNADVFFNPHSKSLLPETQTAIFFFSPNVNFNDSSELVKLILMKNWLLANVADDVYPFQVAGVEQAFNVLPSQSALRINLKAWNDSSANVVKDYIQLMKFSDDEIAFQKFKQVTLVSLQQKVRSADEQISYAIQNIYTEWPTLQDHISLINTVSLKDLKDIYNRFFEKYHAQAVVSGHYSALDADVIVQTLNAHWPTKAVTESELEVIKKAALGKTVNTSSELTLDVPDTASSHTVQFYQLGRSSQKEQVMAAILGEWIGPEFYHELRTEQQLAYSLWAGFATQGQYYGLYMQLESSNTGTEEVNKRILEFVNNWVSKQLPLKSQNDV
ncbi:MAG: insulinase family protein, partial [Bdellovibrionaceae bacterium]|nr:insulinase family protein [Pseudobdellovibrionaceae bacterium]